MTIEVMKRALDALENHNGNYKLDKDECVKYRAVEDSLRAAIKQAEELADWEAIAADQAMTISMMQIMQEKSQEDNEQLIYDAWRDSEAYGIPMTEEGGKLAEIRLRSFRRGWEYHRFYLQHGDVYMKDYLERQDYDE
jgi:hypothetical protein